MAIRRGKTEKVNFSRRLSYTNNVVAQTKDRREANFGGIKASNKMMVIPMNMKKLARKMEVNRMRGRKRESSTLESGRLGSYEQRRGDVRDLCRTEIKSQ